MDFHLNKTKNPKTLLGFKAQFRTQKGNDSG